MAKRTKLQEAVEANRNICEIYAFTKQVERLKMKRSELSKKIANLEYNIALSAETMMRPQADQQSTIDGLRRVIEEKNKAINDVVSRNSSDINGGRARIEELETELKKYRDVEIMKNLALVLEKARADYKTWQTSNTNEKYQNKINWIKELRQTGLLGLREAKDLFEADVEGVPVNVIKARYEQS